MKKVLNMISSLFLLLAFSISFQAFAVSLDKDEGIRQSIFESVDSATNDLTLPVPENEMASPLPLFLMHTYVNKSESNAVNSYTGRMKYKDRPGWKINYFNI